jgi:GNAT superfamily N-acetyltransferase
MKERERNLEIRFASMEDVEKILELSDIALERLSSKSKKEFTRELIRLHIFSPYSHILTAWYGEKLVAFIMYTTDNIAFNRFIKGPLVLIRILFRLIIGAYSYNPRELFSFFRERSLFKRFVFFQKNKKEDEQERENNLEYPPACLTAYATHPSWRGRGIATTLVQMMLEHLRKEGVNGIYAKVHHSNFPSLHTLSKLGFYKKGTIRETHSGTWFILVREIPKEGEGNEE